MRIFIVGDPADLSAVYVGWLAERRRWHVVRLAEERLGLDWWFDMAADGTGDVTVGRDRIALTDVDGAFVRFNPNAAIAEELGGLVEAESVLALERRHGLHWLLDRLRAVVVNRPRAGRSNSSKPLQMRRLAQAGFAVPSWIATNRSDGARRFLESCGGDAVYKSCSGLRSRVRRANAALIESLSDDVAPVVVQRFVPGADVRVHVVGRTCFASEVRSAGVDYRFDEEAVEYAAIPVPDELAARCIRSAAAEGLELAGLDFRRDPDGTWWCLEMNPVPTFLPYEAATGHAIGDAILDHIAGLPTPTCDVSPLTAGQLPTITAGPSRKGTASRNGTIV